MTDDITNREKALIGVSIGLTAGIVIMAYLFTRPKTLIVNTPNRSPEVVDVFATGFRGRIIEQKKNISSGKEQSIKSIKMPLLSDGSVEITIA